MRTHRRRNVAIAANGEGGKIGEIREERKLKRRQTHRRQPVTAVRAVTRLIEYGMARAARRAPDRVLQGYSPSQRGHRYK